MPTRGGLDANDIPCHAKPSFPLGGHGDKSVILIQQHNILLRPHEIIAIKWHMGEDAYASSQDEETYKEVLECPLCRLLVKAVSQVGSKE